MAVSKAPTFLSQLRVTLGRMAYNASGFNKYGLMHDDLLYETPDVEEAIRRLPTKLVDERNYRIMRALQYSGLKKYLPKNEWTKYDEDVRYLQPYLEEVVRERKEKESWEKMF
ncbi:cytochrome b-c1 complex subunit 7-like [Daphnia carinata]|uniref:cytochrome b-c1 complex subunit 7-like n=1 Tax=Daphnia carinata TaxID=120202 RepID=UPI002579D2C9|nr:cytochrome b-c1 complex subunit 7-like [Daphnia carinata]